MKLSNRPLKEIYLKLIFGHIMPLKIISTFFISLLIFLISGCAHYPKTDFTWQSNLEKEHPLVGHIIDTQNMDSISDTELVNNLSKTKYLLIGEKHDNPDHHHLQNWLMHQLLPKNKYQVTFEMMSYDQQTQLDKLSSSSSTSEIVSTADFKNSGWDQELYLPLLQTALKKGAHVSGGNIPKQQIMALYSSNPAILEPAKRFSTMNVLNETQMLSLNDYIYEQHCELMPRSQVGPMSKIQIAKDASLAYSMTRATAPKRMLITGNFHANKTLGVPTHLSKLDKNNESIVIQILEVDQSKQQLEEYEQSIFDQADYIWFTPRWTNRDYCEDLRVQSNQL